MRRTTATFIKVTVFGVVMSLCMTFLFLIFAESRAGSTSSYSAMFANASRLDAGDSVRVAGIRVGTVEDVTLDESGTVLVTFDADRSVALSADTRAEIKYLNLIGDRYLELVVDETAPDRLAPGARIPLDRTAPALSLDLLLGGLKPVIQGLDAREVNALTSSIVQILQGQGGTLESLFSKSSSFTNAIADNNQVVQQLIDQLQDSLSVLSQEGDEFSETVDRLEHLVRGLSQDRDPIGIAIEALDKGTASLTDLLGSAREPLTADIAELNRLAANIAGDKDRIDGTLQMLPDVYRKLARVGSYGSFFPYYICGLTIRASDLEGRTVVFPWITQETGRCVE
ncbi:Lipoprotein LprN [Mycolicibacterium vanbaalenii]|uniref:Lipoprotein LprN n=1 Tax=Mycolicibacterium vanbaalenii TaxID=110539 RepID=A0A5S9QWM0_MYCVN|nr:MCE family protein [Mycolicibacterium vanbaalenii]CAA0124470.1 Lipoprotein LprN [Mycolicibacterium vanbaalenii]